MRLSSDRVGIIRTRVVLATVVQLKLKRSRRSPNSAPTISSTRSSSPFDALPAAETVL